MNQTILNTVYDLPGYPQHTLTYGDILNSLGHQVTDRFLYIGIIILSFSLWFIFDGHKRQDKISIEITGALSYLSLVSGLTSIIFYAISRGWVKI
jgi:hypothetical protein